MCSFHDMKMHTQMYVYIIYSYYCDMRGGGCV